jgi:Protein of unknown function (DUF1579)
VSENSALPQPNPALERLDRLVGTWTMQGGLVGSDETTIRGDTTFSWLAGGFFLEQRAHLDFAGLRIESLELIGYDPNTTLSRQPCSRIYRPRHCRIDSGGWRPNPGADETVNVPYDIGGHRVALPTTGG